MVLEISPDSDELSQSCVSFESVLSPKSSQTWVLLREGPVIIAPWLQREQRGLGLELSCHIRGKEPQKVCALPGFYPEREK